MWRYKTAVYDAELYGHEALEVELESIGQDQWELVNITKTKEGLLMIFKKPAS